MGSVDTEALKASVDLVSVVGAYVPLKKRGAEYIGLCPFHADKNPSFWVIPAKQFCHCFSCGANHDAISFIQEIEGVDFKTAVERLGGKTWTPAAPIAHETREKVADRVTCKPPPNAGRPNMHIRALGEPSATWEYRDAQNEILGYVARYETPEGKQIRCWTWGYRAPNDSSSGQWACGHFNNPRPLYGLARVDAERSRPVVVVEGEKACEAAAKSLPQYVAVTWPGGSQSWHKADWTPLRGRQVLLWPDNDAPGVECMGKLAAILSDPKGLACKVRIIDPKGEADGFDIADWTGTPEELIAWAKPRAKDYAGQQAPEPATIAQEELPPVEVYADSVPPRTQPQPPKVKRPRPRLAAVDGNTALDPGEDLETLPVSMSEDAIADAFAEEQEKDWRYVSAWDEWLHWDGNGWRRDRKELIDRLAVEVCRRAALWSEAASLTPDGRRRLGQRRTAGAVRDLARNDRRIAADPEGWDADPMLVGIPGGVFDIKAGKIIMGERDQYITRRTSVAPAPGEPVRWLEHLRRMMGGDESMIRFLRLYAGYCATGDTREQCFLFLYGMGQTGKGTFLLTLHELLGDYSAMSAASTFMSSQNEKHSSEIARLSGCRLVVIDETEGTARWNEERLKRMTGGGKITAARKYHDEEDITVTWKLAFAGNHKPALRGVGKEMERRIRLVKCTASIPDESVDRNFRARMIEEEGPQILNWILQGAVEWHDAGLPLPEPIADATRDYLTAEDVIGDWLEERCEQTPGGECDRPAAYRNYAAWAEKRGDRAWSNRAWWSALEDRGFGYRKSDGTIRVKGLNLKPQLVEDVPFSYSER